MGFLAAKFRLWQNRDGRTADRVVERSRWNKMCHEAKTCTKEYTSLQNELQAIVARSNGWRVSMKGRRFGLAGALPYMTCAYSTNNAVEQLTKLRCSEDPEEYSRKLGERVVACQQERQTRDIQQPNQVGKEAAQWESAQQQRIEELIEGGQIDSGACGLKEVVIQVQSEVDPEAKAVQTRFRGVSRGLSYTENDELRNEIRRNRDGGEITNWKSRKVT